MERKRIDIVGNGASNTMYTNQKNFVLAFNVPQHGFRYDALAIIDNRPINWMNSNNWHPTVPVFCTSGVKDYAKKHSRQGDWFDYLKFKPRTSAGHLALEYFGTRYEEIHMWGFDSMFSDDLTSQTDKIIPRAKRPPLNNHWYPLWCEYMNKITATVYVHVPEDKKLEVQHERLIETKDLALSI